MISFEKQHFLISLFKEKYLSLKSVPKINYIYYNMMFDRLIAIMVLSLVCTYNLESQNLEKIVFNKENTVVEAFSLSENYSHKLLQELPLISFVIDEIKYNSINQKSKIQLEITLIEGFNPGYKAEIRFVNNSTDTLELSNVVPLGKDNKTAYITGLGNHRLSRTHLFLPNKTPVNCIVPDNAWELGYSSTKLNEQYSICALTRRDINSLEKAKRKRFSFSLKI